jgi:exosortase
MAGTANSRKASDLESTRNVALDILLPIAALTAALVWCYWPVLYRMIKDWQGDPNYSVGQLVPFLCLYLVWTDRERLLKHSRHTCWWGLAVLLLAQCAKFFGLFLMFESAERYALCLSVVGIVLLVGGWPIFWASKWILAILFLMVPLPGRIHNAISGPLQDMATRCSVFVLELLGVTVTREGNTLMLDNSVPVAVAEACSGLRMLTAFIVVAAALAYVINRPAWQKIVLVLSSVPIAIFCNLVRLVITAEMFRRSSSELAEKFFHDFAGWTMMPMAIAILVFELWLMSKLVIPEEEGVKR